MVVTVSTEAPVLFVTEIAPSEQVGAGLTPVETLQISATVVGFNPPTGLMLIVDVADAPGVTEDDGDRAPAETLKSGATTVRVTTLEVLTVKLLSPLNSAVMLWVPAVRADVEKLATLPPLSAELPRCVFPSRKVTVPDGTPAIPGATVAVKVTV